MTYNKCCETVVDNTTKRNRRCKLYRHFREYCYIHSQIFFKDYTMIIQRIWRGFYARKKMKNLFYNLPRELQIHVMKYVRTDHNIEKKWIPSVLKIYKKRLFQCHDDKKDLVNLLNNHMIQLNEFQYNMNNIFLTEKYIHLMINFYTCK